MATAKGGSGTGSAPHILKSTMDLGATWHNKGGANANVADTGGGDSIPYNSGGASENGLYIAQWSQVGEATKYYHFGGRRVAMKDENGVQYLLGDHLGSTSLVLKANGTQEGPTLRYYPYGELRYPSDPSTFPTDYRFTGQRHDGYIKLYQMGARFYDPALGRWISADTIVPEPGNPQDLNRYSYVRGNPLGYIDPSGHTPWWWRYATWQAGMTYLSGFGRAHRPLVHGRNDAAANAEVIKRSAPRRLELMVAASIAHQASDPRDRPYGTDAVEVTYGWIESNQSAGIAQIRPGEIERWAPSLAGESRYNPEVAVRVMTAKLQYAESSIFGAQRKNGRISKTDHYMLLALTQNCSSEKLVLNTVSTFFAAGRDWDAAFDTELAQRNDWKEQLRLMVLHMDWLVLNGWELPEGVDLYYMRKKAFED